MFQVLTPNGRRRPTMFFCTRILCLLALASTAFASSIRQLHVNEVADTAELIFSGSVVSSESRYSSGSNRIRTWVTFEVDQVLKGRINSNLLTLGFAGGRVGSQEQVYEGMRYPQIGEHGVYFVESSTRPLVNPLVGWSQGHFKSVYSKNAYNMLTADSKPIQRVSFHKQKSSVDEPYLSRGHALGVDIETKAEGVISKDQFIGQIEQYLNNTPANSERLLDK